MSCETSCYSCGMPFSKDPLGDKRESKENCSYCFNNGKLCYEGNDLKEFQKICYEEMRKHGTSVIMAKIYTFFIRFAPRWKNKKD